MSGPALGPPGPPVVTGAAIIRRLWLPQATAIFPGLLPICTGRYGAVSMRARAPLYVWHLQAAALPGHRGTAAALLSTQHDPRNDIASILRRFHTVDRGHNRGVFIFAPRPRRGFVVVNVIRGRIEDRNRCDLGICGLAFASAGR